MNTDFDRSEDASYEVRVPDNFEPDMDIPTMEQVVEKHLFVADRKATGQNTFPDLLVKGIYVGGEECSAVFSLKYRPEANVRVWKGDVDSVISNITDQRDPRKPIADFLGEWDIKEITFKGVTVEHIITGEVETYLVDYTPAKHVKDNAIAGYGQGGILETAGPKGQKTASSINTQKQGGFIANPQAQAIMQMRNMVQNMTPEQRAKLAERIKGGGQQNQQNGDKNTTSKKSSSKKSSSKKQFR
jgi:hypothetical protein